MRRLALLFAVLAIPALGARAAAPIVVLDGAFDEWPSHAAALADHYHLYFRLELPAVDGLQASALETRLLLDLDDDATSGAFLRPADASAPLGVDLALLFAPAFTRDDAGIGGGAAALVYDGAGRERRLRHAQVDFAALPTHASDRYELRLSRHALQDRRVGPMLRAGGRARARVQRIDPQGTVRWESAMMVIERPVAAEQPWRADVALPERPPGGVRVMSINVRWATPLREPEPLARLLHAAEPDIVLLQEWDRVQRDTRGRRPPRVAAAEIAAWFDEHVPGERRWDARRSRELGVAVVARGALAPFGPERVSYQLEAGEGELVEGGVRYLGVLAELPVGAVAVASLHLKCCGSRHSAEESRRLAEAAAINAALRRGLAGSDPVLLVVGGDFNLVGGREPRDRVAEGLAPGGGPLAVASAFALGGHSALTWRDGRSRFAPSRLDFVLFAGEGAVLLNAFTLDTGLLSDAALERLELRREDSAFSDHLPLIVDLEPRPTESSLMLRRSAQSVR